MILCTQFVSTPNSNIALNVATITKPIYFPRPIISAKIIFYYIEKSHDHSKRARIINCDLLLCKLNWMILRHKTIEFNRLFIILISKYSNILNIPKLFTHNERYSESEHKCNTEATRPRTVDACLVKFIIFFVVCPPRAWCPRASFALFCSGLRNYSGCGIRLLHFNAMANAPT